ncbi:MAG: hypothetical protein E7568_04070 [Ruminococcaceae bacterium]|nr:hypothetical protein [Oscillospiraceae bacterium]
MICRHCGFEANEDFKFCPKCGKDSSFVTPTIILNPATAKITSSLRDNLFLVICILMTCACGLGVISGGLPLINILLTIFLWLGYSKFKKGIIDVTPLKNISGTVYASYVITNVCYIILIVCGVILTLLLGLIANNRTAINEIVEIIGSEFPVFLNIPYALYAVLAIVIGVAILIGAVAGLLINILGLRKIHRFAQSVYKMILNEAADFYNPRAAKNWLIAFGVFMVVSAVTSIGTSFFAALSNGCNAAACFISASLINKYFLSNV